VGFCSLLSVSCMESGWCVVWGWFVFWRLFFFFLYMVLGGESHLIGIRGYPLHTTAEISEFQETAA